MINHNTLERLDALYDIEDQDDTETNINVNELSGGPLKARQRIEIYWERKLLERNLYDVLADEDLTDVNALLPTSIQQDPVMTNSHV